MKPDELLAADYYDWYGQSNRVFYYHHTEYHTAEPDKTGDTEQFSYISTQKSLSAISEMQDEIVDLQSSDGTYIDYYLLPSCTDDGILLLIPHNRHKKLPIFEEARPFAYYLIAEDCSQNP